MFGRSGTDGGTRNILHDPHCVRFEAMRSYSLHLRPIDAILLLDRILGEKPCHEGRIEIRANLHYGAVYKSTDPAIPVVEPETILRRG